MSRIGIIGGSGLNDPGLLKEPHATHPDTPYGKPSSPLTSGVLEGREVVLLARHGPKHEIPPTQVNYRANIRALKDAGCTHVLATTAVGSLREEIRPGDFAVPDQFIDFTRQRPVTYYESFEKGIRHASLADPFDPALRAALIASCKGLSFPVHGRGTVVTIEGPRFSTRAESNLFRQWGADIINMSIAPEAILAREAGLPYAVIAMATDYDCWKQGERPVAWEEVLAVFADNVARVKQVLLGAVARIG